jgi:Tol biopolymer transport system component
VIFRIDDAKTGFDIAITSLKDGHTVVPLIQTPFNELNAETSPDGRWLAYQSNESGQDEIYVRPFPDLARGRWQVSSAGGTRPLWSRNGRELFFLASNGLNVVTVAPGSDFSAGRQNRLIGRRYFADTAFVGRTYDIAPDGERFLMIKPGGVADDRLLRSDVIVVQGWFEELKRAAPGK